MQPTTKTEEPKPNPYVKRLEDCEKRQAQAEADIADIRKILLLLSPQVAGHHEKLLEIIPMLNTLIEHHLLAENSREQGKSNGADNNLPR